MSEATYELLPTEALNRAIDSTFGNYVDRSDFLTLTGSSCTADQIIRATRAFDRKHSNRSDWEAILHTVLKNKSQVRTLLAMF